MWICLFYDIIESKEIVLTKSNDTLRL